MIPKQDVIWRLLLLWLIGAGAILGVMVIQLIGGAIADPASAFGWFGTVVLPAPTLLVGALFAPAGQSGSVDRRAWIVAMIVSTFHLLLVAAAFVWFALQSDRPMADIMSDSNHVLALTQGLLTFMLGRLAGSGR